MGNTSMSMLNVAPCKHNEIYIVCMQGFLFVLSRPTLTDIQDYLFRQTTVVLHHQIVSSNYDSVAIGVKHPATR